MASAVPCIGLKNNHTDAIVATHEIIRDGKTGYIVDSYPVEELANKIQILMRDETMRRFMGEKARKICVEEYTWRLHVESLLSLCNEMSA